MSVQEQREAQESMQDHQANLQQAQSMAPDFSDRREYLEAVIKDELDDASVRMLRNMTSPDFILSNLRDAEINEIKLLREITVMKVKAAHPHPNSAMRGERRQQVYQDGSPAVALSQNQKALIDQFVRGAFVRVARSRDGFQQDQFGKTVGVSERRTEDTEEGGFLSFS